MRYFFIIFLLVFCTGNVFSQNAQNSEPVKISQNKDTIVVKKKSSSEKYMLTSPQLTLKTFFYNLKKDNYHPEIAAKAIYSKELTPVQKEEYAEKIKKIVDGSGLIIDIHSVPDDPDYIDSTSKTAVYILDEHDSEIYLEKIGNKWFFSEETIKEVPELYKKISPFDLSFIVNILPDFMHKEVLSNEIWKYFGLFFYILFMFVIYKILSSTMGYILSRIIRKIGKENIGKAYLIPVANPISILLVILILLSIIPTLEFNVKFNAFLLSILKITIPVVAIFIAFRIINLLSYFFEKLALKTKSSLDDHLVPFARKGLKGFVIVLGAFYILDVLNINITPLLAGVSIGGLAFALAAQDTVKNIFGSLTIFVDQPFGVGDWIKFPEGEGIIEEIGLRSTRIRTFENSLITIPNGKISDSVIDNMGKRMYRRYNTMLGVIYSTPMPLLEAFMEGIKRIILEHPNTLKDSSVQAAFYTYNSSSLDIRVNMYFDVPEFQDELKARQEINSKIYELAAYLGISFAFPTQSIFIEKEAQYNEEDLKNIKDKMNNFFGTNAKEIEE